jgi:hypothetical protein
MVDLIILMICQSFNNCEIHVALITTVIFPAYEKVN